MSFAERLVAGVPILLRLQLIRFRRDRNIRPPVRFEPLPQLAIALHPAPSGVQHEDRQPQLCAPQQVAFNELFPLPRNVLGNLCETISRKIDKAKPIIELEEIDRLRTTGPRTGVCQPVGPHQ